MTSAQNLPSMKPLANSAADARLTKPEVELHILDPETASALYAEWSDDAQSTLERDQLEQLESQSGIKPFLSAVFSHSPHLVVLAKQYPLVIHTCHVNGFQSVIDQTLHLLNALDITSCSEADLMQSLRKAKNQVSLVCGLADLGGWWSWETVSRSISLLADICVQRTVEFLLLQAHHAGKVKLPDAATPLIGSGYVVLAMGKHGAAELNYSSDIDLIVLFDPDAPAILERDESVTVFVRLTKALVRILQDRTADGYVFRTDLRLRPDPGSMPLAVPLPLALNYYESRGQNWERAALIKARVIAGDQAVGFWFLKQLEPFIWRRHLDYAAISDVHSIKRQIQSHRGIENLQVPGHNVKLGRGGIREIEFFVQTQQLIAGGRNPDLREMRTCEMLDKLVENEWIEPATSKQLAASYAYLRDVEHRLQMKSDEQTHSLPTESNELTEIAAMCGYSRYKKFAADLTLHLVNVEQHYAALFSQSESLSVASGNLSFTGDDDDPGTIEALETMGYSRPSKIISLVKGWHYGRHPVLQSKDAREQLTELTPALLTTFADTKRADDTVFAFDEFLTGLPAGIQLFSVLRENAKLLDLLTLILSAAPRISNIITRRPHVFDGVLEPGFFNERPDADSWDDILHRSLRQARDYEDGLDRARIFAAEQRFLIGMRLLGGTITPQEAGVAFSDLAEILLLGMARWVQKHFELRHGKVPQSEYVLIAMGNFGTHELTASSDLDLQLIYEFDEQLDESDGQQPLHASQYFGRFAQRLIAAMSAATAQGIVYELDFRLRPNGNDGPIATSLRAFENHHANSSWTWERMALTRSRVLGPSTPFAKKVDAVIQQVVEKQSDTKAIVKDALEMRKLMDEERQGKGVWDLKLTKGGLVDIEFLAQALALANAPCKRGSACEILQSFPGDELQNDNVTLLKAHTIFSSVAQILRLCLDDPTKPQAAPPGLVELVLAELEMPDLKTAEAYLKDTQRTIRQIFLKRLKSVRVHS